MENYFKQDKFYSTFGTETATAGYVLLNLGIGLDIRSASSALFSIYFNANNLTNVAFQSHLSRLKYGPVNNATARTGVYSIVRNYNIKLIVPIN